MDIGNVVDADTVAKVIESVFSNENLPIVVLAMLVAWALYLMARKA